MIIADTSIWIEFFKGNLKYFPVLESLLEERKVFALECIFGELLQGAKSKKDTNFILAYWFQLPKVDSSGTWIAAGQLSSQGKLFARGVGLIDLAILAAARRHHYKIWTLDKKLMSILQPHEQLLIFP